MRWHVIHSWGLLSQIWLVKQFTVWWKYLAGKVRIGRPEHLLKPVNSKHYVSFSLWIKANCTQIFYVKMLIHSTHKKSANYNTLSNKNAGDANCLQRLAFLEPKLEKKAAITASRTWGRWWNGSGDVGASSPSQQPPNASCSVAFHTISTEELLLTFCQG